jgi:hypothetical protein
MVYHVKREANGVAHALAKNAFFGISEQVWLEEIPPCIFYVVSIEQDDLSS